VSSKANESVFHFALYDEDSSLKYYLLVINVKISVPEQMMIQRLPKGTPPIFYMYTAILISVKRKPEQRHVVT
jgi:hypothetical protein